MKITANKIVRDYEKLKKNAERAIDFKNYELALTFISIASNLMYQSNLFYTDDKIEMMIHKIGEEIIPKKEFLPLRKRIVFYDYFVLDNRGLTEQYINSFFNQDEYDLYFINSHEENQNGKEIYKQLRNNNIEIFEINEKSEIAKTRKLYDLICDIKPEAVIAHTAPWDLSGLITFSMLEGLCKRYLSNITDHAYWLGTHCFDYFFEWRDYGCNISSTYRKIESEKLLKLPYYPIVNKNISFNGFPFDIKDRKLIFSGGALYKIQGSDKFLYIIKHILNKYKDTIFLFLGSGDSSFLQKFIVENNFQERFFVLPERKDVYEVMKHCYLYINTYPLIGGLMTQLACVAGKLPLTLNDNNDLCNNIYELLNNHKEIELQYNSVEKMIEKIDFYLENENQLHKDSEKVKDFIITDKEYKNLLFEYLETPINKIKISKYNIDAYCFSQNYINRFNENNCKSYLQCFIRKNIFTCVVFFKYYIIYIIYKVINKI